MKNSQNKTAFLILAVFAVISLVWSVFVPVFESPDESTDYEFGRYFARTWKLPVLTDNPRPQGVHVWEPLYFYILGSVSKVIDAPLSDNSKYNYSEPWKRIREENPLNLYRHDPSEFKFNWDRLAWSLHLMRLVSVLLSIGSVWFVYKMGREIFPEPSWLPIAGMMLFAFNPQFLFLGSVLNVVDMVVFSTAILLWLLARFMKQEAGKTADIVVLGVSMGMAILSKMTALPILAVVAIGIAWKKIIEKKPFVNAVLLFTTVFMLTGGWYLVRNQALYGEPTGAKIHVLARLGKMANPFLEEVGLLNFLISYPKTQWTTFWSGYGWITVYLPKVFPLMMLVLYAHGIWGFALAMRGRKKLILSSVQRRQMAVLIMAPIVVWLGISRVIFLVEVFHGKDLFLVSGVLAIAVVIGLKNLAIKMRKNDWMSVKIKRPVTLAMGLLTAFWMRQPELAKFAKGIATISDVGQLLATAIIGMAFLNLIWTVLRSLQIRNAVRCQWQKNGARWVIRLLLLVAAANISILFGLMVPAMYNESVWELIIGG